MSMKCLHSSTKLQIEKDVASEYGVCIYIMYIYIYGICTVCNKLTVSYTGAASYLCHTSCFAYFIVVVLYCVHVLWELPTSST